MIRAIAFTFTILGLAALGCERAPTTAKRDAEVRLGYFANVTHAQAVLGVASGDFQRAVAPARLTTRVFNAGPALIEALFAGEIDIAYVGPGPAINAHGKSRGRGIRVISGAAANGVVIVARADAPIYSLSDLAGRRVATPQLGNTQDISARHYLKSTFGTADNVLPVANAEQSALMARKELDAAWVPEPWGAKLLSDGARFIAEEKDLWPNQQLGLTLVIASPDFLRNQRDLAARFLAAHRSWTRRLADEPQAHAVALDDAIFALTAKRLGKDVIADSLTRVRFTDDPLPDTLATLSQWAFELGYSRQPIAVDGLIDASFSADVAATQGQ